MKKIVTLFVLVFSLNCAMAETIIVNTATAGTLSTLIDTFPIPDLKITGNINATDLGILKSRIKVRNGLVKLDLSEATYSSNIFLTGAFWSFPSLQTLIFPSAGITEIATNAARNCSKLTKVVFPKTSLTIKGGVFTDCTSLNNVDIPEGCINIEANVFKNCTSLTSIYLPSTLATMQTDVFAGCSSLSKIYYNSVKPPYSAGNPMATASPNITVYVPSQTAKDAFNANAYWFLYDIETYDFTLYTGVTNAINGKACTIERSSDGICIKGVVLPSEVRIYQANGTLITTQIIATENNHIALSPNKFYIVIVNGNASKIIL